MFFVISFLSLGCVLSAENIDDLELRIVEFEREHIDIKEHYSRKIELELIKNSIGAAMVHFILF